MSQSRMYSQYSREEIVTKFGFKQISQILMDLARNDDEREKVYNILYNGGFDDFSVNGISMDIDNSTDMFHNLIAFSNLFAQNGIRINRNNPSLESRRRIAYANLLVTHPETFSLIAENNITLFHGTNSNALPSILRHGMKSHQKLDEQGIQISTGEEWSRFQGSRSFISFTDNPDIAIDYSSFGTSDGSAFPVIIGLSSDALKRQETCIVDSRVPEVGIIDSIDLADIGFIGVPQNRVDLVRLLVKDTQIIVAPIDTASERFYYYPIEGAPIIDNKKAQNLLEGFHSSKEPRLLGKDDVRQVAETRRKSNISNIISTIRSILYDKFQPSIDLESEGKSHE